MIGFLDVLLRGLALCGQALAVGGVFFAMLILRPAARADSRWAAVEPRTLLLIAAGATVVVLAQGLSVSMQLGSLVSELNSSLSTALATSYFAASVARTLVCGLVIVTAIRLRRRTPSLGAWLVLLGLSLLLPLGAAGTSHAAARLEHRVPLLALDTLHQLAAGVWVGGLFHLVVAASRDGRRQWPTILLQHFSALSFAAVMGLILSGVGLSLYYIDSPRGLIGTGYGLMVLTKIVILALLMVMGGWNFTAVRRLPASSGAPPLLLRRFVEVELGLGLTVLFAASSLTSLPPAVDVVTDRATPGEVALRFTPRWPSLTSPPIELLPIHDREAPRTDEDRAWSEFNHHIAGLFVLAMGVLAIVHRFGAAWARHWPLVFLGMAVFLMVRNDPGAWPLGPQGFWEGMRHAEVVQHRIFVLIVIAFGVFEWMVRTGRLRSRACSLVFPILCVVGGGLLLTHSHASLNLKAEYLVEVTHAPLGVLALAMGWARWLELRLPGDQGRFPGRVWAAGLSLIGVLLLLYRES